jgi:hypothetical protein
MNVSKAGDASRKDTRELKSKSGEKFEADNVISRNFSWRNLPNVIGVLIV